VVGVTTYTIGEVADRSGFSASALRYYEGIGLMEPAGRTDAGYRLYDERTLARLAFIARAKQLGCSLEEITDLVSVWDGERCGPVQRRFHDLVTDKIAEAQRQLLDLTAFTAQLHTAAAQLAGPATDGPCDDACACLHETATAATQAVPVLLAANSDEPPIACALDATAMPDRLAAWGSILDHARSRTARGDGALRVELDDDVSVTELAELVAAEQRCCAFFSFAITIDDRGVALEVSAPSGAEDVVASLFGQHA
jgi:MerR family transcriptional regulator, copper efflux regulator